MGRNERIALWVVVGLLGVWLLVVTVTMAGELAAIDAVLGGGDGVGEVAAPGEPTSWWGEETGEASGSDWGGGVGAGSSSGPQIGIAGVEVVSNSLVMTVTVRSSGAGDLLYEPPLLVDETGLVYQVEGESLEAARYAFLDLITQGQATAQLRFAGAPAPGVRSVLVFDPNRQPGDALAPRVEVLVPAAPTPQPEEG
jgi:hypothetical protein